MQAQPRNGFRLTATMGYQLPGALRGPAPPGVMQLNQGGNNLLGGNQGQNQGFQGFGGGGFQGFGGGGFGGFGGGFQGGFGGKGFGFSGETGY